MTNRTVVVLGGGTGGLVAARRLRRSLDATDRVVLVDRSATYRFAPSLLWVLTGARRPEQISTDRRRLRRSGIEVLEAEVLEIDPAHRKGQDLRSRAVLRQPSDRARCRAGARRAARLRRRGPQHLHAGRRGRCRRRAESLRGRPLGGGRVPPALQVSRRPLRGGGPRRSASATPRRPRPHHHRHLHTRALPDADRRPGAGRCPRRHARRAGHHAAP